MNGLLAAIQRALGDGSAGAAARHRQRAEDRRGAGSADPRRRVLHVLGAQDPRLDARARRAESRRLERRAATVRRRHQDAPQRDRAAVEGQPIPVPDGARPVARAGVRRVGRRAAQRHVRHRRHRRRTPLCIGVDVARHLRRHPRGLGVELEVRVLGRHALGCADGGVRDRDGLCARRRADGRRQPELGRHHSRATGHERLRAGSSGRCSRCSSSTSSRVSPKPIARRSTSPRANPRSSRASTSSTRVSRSACSFSPSTRT